MLRLTLALVALVAAAHAGSFEEIVAEVNTKGALWTAAVPTRFGSIEDGQRLCGTYTKGHPKYNATNLPVATYAPTALPTNFDSRTNWANCSVISKVRDQSACGSCWAFGSTEAFEDRRCIATNEDVEFSTEDTAGCCTGALCGFSQGCNGGQPSAALSWMTVDGVVTGGDYPDIGAGSSCKPYLLKPCAHHVPPSAQYPACPSAEYTVSCTRQCSERAYTKAYTSDKTKGKKAFSLGSVQDMMQSIFQEGPLAVAFTVYSDFLTYKSGVYHHVTGQALGGHAVEMVGWGVESGVNYWLVKNSWNDQWGDGGFFKILRGSDECGIEDDVSGVSF